MRKENHDIDNILAENAKRLADIDEPFDPISGLGSIGYRQRVCIPDFAEGREFYFPTSMIAESKLVRRIVQLGSIHAFMDALKIEPTEENRSKVAEAVIRTRLKHDVAFYFASVVKIKPKRNSGTGDAPFILNRPQRKILIPALERERIAHKPIRKSLVKARQWGGSTGIQQYFGWWQTQLFTSLNSLIVGHLTSSAIEVQDMFKKTLDYYPLRLLHDMGEPYSLKESKFTSVFGNPNIHRIPQRNCKIKIGSAQTPDSARGGDYSLVHCTEVGLWKKTDKMTPEDIIDSATSGVLYEPNTCIVYESTAKGTGNFFHREYLAAKDGASQFDPLFVAWYDIDLYSLPFSSNEARADFANALWANREASHADSNREEPGRYLWYLWNQGATLEAIHWYVEERRKYNDHGHMASEYPSDDIEAFVFSGAHVFDRYKVEALRPTCNVKPKVGGLSALNLKGADALKEIRFNEDPQGELWVWEEPDLDPDHRIANRYAVAVDIGGRSDKADWSIVVVLDRYWMMEGDKPVIVAQMRCHMDMDILAWKAAQVASWYDNALLIIESNTLETKDRDRYVDGDNSVFILDQIKDVYPNLYARKQSYEEIQQKKPLKYGFHTNTLTKPLLIANLITFVREGLYVERDARALDELLQYERKQNGSYGAIQGYHDDLLMARAILLYVSSKEMDLPYEIKPASFHTMPRKVIGDATI